MLTVVALGGNALLRRGQPLDAALQRANVKAAAEIVADIANEHRIVVTHGNGPQVGLLSLQNEAYDKVRAYPLDVLDAETEGMVGYIVEQELGRHLRRDRLATLLTQVVVDPDDAAFSVPTKFVGPAYQDERDARFIAHERGWTVKSDGVSWRRVVPSPDPVAIVEIDTIRLLVEHDVIVICSGGGGIPVVPDAIAGLSGVEAVIDKDLSAALLATQLGADALLLLTDVEGVYTDWGTPRQQLIREATPERLRALGLPPGSMGPKAEAACRFIEAGGRVGAIGALEHATAILLGQAGTIVRGSGS
jgi:carbamate kinase